MLGIVAIYGRPETGATDFALERFNLGETWIALETLKERFPNGNAAT
jgi:hypothetical protein